MTIKYDLQCLVCGEHVLTPDEMEKHVCKINPEKIYKKAIYKFGADIQVLKAVEEMSELQKECCKWFISFSSVVNIDNHNEIIKNIHEEIADVEIMLEQLKLIFDCHDIINTVKQQKIERLKGLVENG